MQVISKNSKSVQDGTTLHRAAPGTVVEADIGLPGYEGGNIYLVAPHCGMVSLQDGVIFQSAPSQPVRIIEGVTYYQCAPSQNFVDRHLLNNNR